MIPDTKNGLPAMACVSAMQKSIRRGLEKEAMQFACELLHTSKAFHSMVCNRLIVICREDLDTLAVPHVFPFVAASLAASNERYSSKLGEARLMIANCIRMMCRAPKSRAGCHFGAAVGLRSLLEDYTPEIPDWAFDQHTMKGKAMGRGLDHFRKRARSWFRRRPLMIPTKTKPIGCGRSSSRASDGAARSRREPKVHCVSSCGAIFPSGHLPNGRRLQSPVKVAKLSDFSQLGGIMPAITPEPILKIAMGFMAAKFLFAASEIGLFEALADGPVSMDEIATRIAVPQRTTGIVVAAMDSLGLIEREGTRYRNSTAAAAFLAGKPGRDLRSYLRHSDRINYLVWSKLSEALRHEQSQFPELNHEQQSLYSACVEEFTTAAATALANAYDFSRHRCLLDLAGGTGSFLLTILRHYPTLKGTLFELPNVCAVARERLAKEPEQARIAIIEGDALRSSLPKDHDAVLVANAIHMFSVAHNRELLHKIRAVAEVGTRLLLVDLWTNPTHSQPLPAALMSGQFLLVSGEGQSYSEQEADGWLHQAGWRKHHNTPLAGPISLIVAEAM